MKTGRRRISLGWKIASLIVPLLHVLVWIAAASSYPKMGNVEPLVLVDFPISFILVIVGWNSPHLMIWFGVVGTPWWFLLVRITEAILHNFSARSRNRSDTPPEL